MFIYCDEYSYFPVVLGMEREKILKMTNFFEGLVSPVVCVDSDCFDKEELLNFANIIKFFGNSCCLTSTDEPLNHPGFTEFLEQVFAEKFKIGLVTNGLKLNEHMDVIIKCCSWITIPIITVDIQDMSSMEYFKIIQNISSFIHKRPMEGPPIRISFDMYPDNYHQVYEAAILAKSIHVDKFTILPRIKENLVWYPELLEKTFKTLDRVVNLEDETFQVSNLFIKEDDAITIF